MRGWGYGLNHSTESTVENRSDPDKLELFWLAHYAPEVIATEARRYPPIAAIADALGPRTEVLPVPIPLDCMDGFNEAYYGRPERLLDADARRACSAWSFVKAAARRSARLPGRVSRGAFRVGRRGRRTIGGR